MIGDIKIRPGIYKRGSIIIYSCMDCEKIHPECFMVEKTVWKEAGFNHPDGLDGCICIGCFEKRLKRPIMIKDLTDTPCNELPRFFFGLTTKIEGLI